MQRSLVLRRIIQIMRCLVYMQDCWARQTSFARFGISLTRAGNNIGIWSADGSNFILEVNAVSQIVCMLTRTTRCGGFSPVTRVLLDRCGAICALPSTSCDCIVDMTAASISSHQVDLVSPYLVVVLIDINCKEPQFVQESIFCWSVRIVVVGRLLLSLPSLMLHGSPVGINVSTSIADKRFVNAQVGSRRRCLSSDFAISNAQTSERVFTCCALNIDGIVALRVNGLLFCRQASVLFLCRGVQNRFGSGRIQIKSP